MKRAHKILTSILLVSITIITIGIGDAVPVEEWNKTYFHSEYPEEFSFFDSVQQTSDGGYIASGIIGVAGETSSGGLIVKTDINGNKLWYKIFENIISSIQQTTDGGYIITGVCCYFDTYADNVWLTKIDSNGNKLWNKTFKESGTLSVQQTTDGGYIIAGSTYNQTAWLIKTNNNGNKLWNITFKESSFDYVRQTKDGGYILAGTKHNGLITNDWLVKLSPDIPPINLLKNPGFETTNPSNSSSPLYWSKFQTGTKALFTCPEIGRTTPKSASIKYTTKETGKVALWQQSGIPVIPNKQYKLSGYMKLQNVTGGRAGLRINWYKSDGNITKIDLITKSGTSNWTKYEKTFTSPSNAVRANVGGDLFNASGKVWFDDLSFTRVSRLEQEGSSIVSSKLGPSR